jgi:HK97 family phage portal protein
MPSHLIDIISNGMFPARALGYILSMLPGHTYTPDTILHEKYFNPQFDVNGNQLYGMSPIRAGLKRLQKANLQITAEAAGWSNEGIKGIIALKNPLGVVGEEMQSSVESLANTMRTEWQGAQNRGRMAISSQDLSWIPIGLNSEEMQMIESGLVDLRMMCNWFGGVPSQLLNDPARSTYNTVSEAEKALTTRCVLPELCSTKDAYNRKFSQDWGLPKGVIVDFDISVFSELQEDVAKVATWTSQLIAISPNEQRELCGLGALPNPEMSEPWVMPIGRQPLSERQPTDVDNDLNNDDADNGEDI